MAVIHISEAEAARDLSSILTRVSAGEQVQIDKDSESFLIVPVVPGRRLEQPRLISEILASMKEHPSDAKLDDQFGNDLEEVIRLHEHERLRDPWESF